MNIEHSAFTQLFNQLYSRFVVIYYSTLKLSTIISQHISTKPNKNFLMFAPAPNFSPFKAK